jgi:hypothetical protein
MYMQAFSPMAKLPSYQLWRFGLGRSCICTFGALLSKFWIMQQAINYTVPFTSQHTSPSEQHTSTTEDIKHL